MLDRLMQTFDDLQNKILAGLGIVIVSWAGYITTKVIDAPSKSDIENMIENAQNSSLYAQDRGSIQRSIEDLYEVVHSLTADKDRMKDAISLNNDKIIANNQLLWAALGELRVEVEKVKLMLEHSGLSKKKRIEEGEEPTSNPGTNETEPPPWREF
jgi:hypothetical protein